MFLVGELLALLSGLSFAAAATVIAKSSTRAAGDNGALLSVVATALLSGLLWVPSFSTRGLPDLIGASESIAWFALAGLLTIIAGRTLYFHSVAALGAVKASAVNRLIPFFSVIAAATILQEAITPPVVMGMLLIASSFGILIWRSLNQGAASSSGDARSPRIGAYIFGPASSMSYAAGYLCRKFGLLGLADPAFGTMVGALTALAVYPVLALFIPQYRQALRDLGSKTTRLHLMAAVFISGGQIAQFAAFSYIEVSRVVMIASAETFFSILLSVYVVKLHWPDRDTILAAVLSVAGVVLVAAA